MIRTLLFDLGNVLVHFSHELMCAQIGALCGCDGGEVERVLLGSGLQERFERGEISEQQFRFELERQFGSRLDAGELYLAGSDIFALNDAIVPILDRLKRAGHRLILCSNTSISHFRFVSERFGILDGFDDFVLSFEVGATKPDAPMFEAALSKIGCRPAECFYADDVSENVDAGRSHGLQAEVFTSVEKLVHDLARVGVEVAG